MPLPNGKSVIDWLAEYAPYLKFRMSTSCFSTSITCLVGVSFLVVLLPKVVGIAPFRKDLIAPNLVYPIRKCEFHHLIVGGHDDLMWVNCGPFEDGAL